MRLAFLVRNLPCGSLTFLYIGGEGGATDSSDGCRNGHFCIRLVAGRHANVKQITTVPVIFTSKLAVSRQEAVFRQQKAPVVQAEPLNFRPEPPVDSPEPSFLGVKSVESAAPFLFTI